MFIKGFEKTAVSLDPSKALGYVAGKLAKVPKAVGEFKKGREVAFAAGARAGSTGVKRTPGQGLAQSRYRRAVETDAKAGVQKSPKALEGLKKSTDKGAKIDVEKRQAKIEKSKNPSFARKHPFLTAGGLYLGARYALGGTENKDQQQQPQVNPGQY